MKCCMIFVRSLSPVALGLLDDIGLAALYPILPGFLTNPYLIPILFLGQFAWSYRSMVNDLFTMIEQDG